MVAIVGRNNLDQFIEGHPKRSNGHAEHSLGALGDATKASLETVYGMKTAATPIVKIDAFVHQCGYMIPRIQSAIAVAGFLYTITATITLIQMVEKIKNFAELTAQKVVKIVSQFFDVLSCLPYFCAFVAQNSSLFLQWAGTAWLSLVYDVSSLAVNMMHYFDVKKAFYNPALLSTKLEKTIHNDNRLTWAKNVKDIVSIALGILAVVSLPVGGIVPFATIVLTLGAIKAVGSLGIQYYKTFWIESSLNEDLSRARGIMDRVQQEYQQKRTQFGQVILGIPGAAPLLQTHAVAAIDQHRREALTSVKRLARAQKQARANIEQQNPQYHDAVVGAERLRVQWVNSPRANRQQAEKAYRAAPAIVANMQKAPQWQQAFDAATEQALAQ